MHRRLVYTGQSPQDLDINQNAQFQMIAAGFLAEAIVGQGPWAAGLALTATSPASLSLNVGRGTLAQMDVVDETSPGTSDIADTASPLLKIGINLAPTALTFVAPPTAGTSQVFLIQGRMQEGDTGAEILPFYNPTPPYPSFAGPANSGASDNTIRQQVVALQSVAGAPASTGSQTAPSVTSGWSPLYLVTLANGQTTITSSSFAVHPDAPFLLYTLPQLSPSRSLIRAPRQFLSSGSYTPPAGLGSIVIYAVGAGGGGGGSLSDAMGGASAGGGGGSGGEGDGFFTASQLATALSGGSLAVTIGAGGTGGGGTSSGSAGQPTTVGSLMTCYGGLGGAPGVNSASQSVAAGGGATAIAVGANLRAKIGTPGLPGLVLNGTANAAFSGAGAPSHYGAGGSATVTNHAGNNGGLGAGGSGACTGGAIGLNGGTGGTGYVEIWEFT